MRRNKLNIRRKFERLEDRRMMVGDIDFDDGILTVTGYDFDDVVQVRFTEDHVTVDLTAKEGSGTNADTSHHDRTKEISDVTKIVFNGLAGKDKLTVFFDGQVSDEDLNGISLEFHGGDNEDTLTQLGGGMRTEAFGEGGRDILQGSRFNDTLEGGIGNDDLSGGAGNDTYKFVGSLLGNDNVIEAANADIDTLDFRGFTGGGINLDLTVTTPRTINSGDLSLRLSSSTGIENVFGTDFEDTIRGNTRDNEIHGGALRDKIFGNAGADKLFGEGGRDDLFGEAGLDTLDGGDDRDFLDGGFDTLKDILIGGGDIDTFVGHKRRGANPGPVEQAFTDFVSGFDVLMPFAH